MVQGYRGVYTAIVTPFRNGGKLVDWEGLSMLCEFQAESGISGIVAVGTTGESPTLTWDEHIEAFRVVSDAVPSRATVIASTGSNSTAECLEGTKHAFELGIRHALLVDPYYNGPSSLEIRREYLEPVAAAFPEVNIIPYIIPGRCGTQLLAHDLSIAYACYKNICAVKEATGNLDHMRLIRKLCGNDFNILSGDDDRTLQMMTEDTIKASGVISVVSNVVPKAVQEMCQSVLEGNVARARSIANALKPLFEIVTVNTTESTRFGEVPFKARNPLPIKTLMGVLGLPGGAPRPPLGKMTKRGLQVLLSKVRAVHINNPEVLDPVARFFDVDLDERLTDERFWKGWTYDDY